MLTSLLTDTTTVKITTEADTRTFFEKASDAFREVIKLCDNDVTNTKDLHMMTFYEFIDDDKKVRTISSPERFELWYYEKNSNGLYEISIVKTRDGIIFDIVIHASIENNEHAFSMFKNVASCFVNLEA